MRKFELLLTEVIEKLDSLHTTACVLGLCIFIVLVAIFLKVDK